MERLVGHRTLWEGLDVGHLVRSGGPYRGEMVGGILGVGCRSGA
jgi:hypothetical protein